MPPPLYVYTPWPPSRCGAAQYCAELLPHLRPDWDIMVVVDDDAPDPVCLPPGVAATRRSNVDHADPNILRLYQSGNNIQHRFVWEEVQRCPGVTVLHDYVHHHLIVDMTLAQADAAGYERWLASEHGEHGRQVADQRLYSPRGERGQFFSEQQAFLMPLNGPVLNHSLGVIVHSHTALQGVLQQRPHLPAIRVPLQHTPLAQPAGSRQAARAVLGLPQDRLILCTVGFLTDPKQVHLVLQALRTARSQMPDFQYWLVGDLEGLPRMQAFQRQVVEAGLEGLVFNTGYIEAVEFYRYMEAADLVINLRYPSAGETSATLVRALGLGRCAMVFDYESYADFPDGTVLRVPLDTVDARPLAQALVQAAQDAALRERIGEAARRWVEEEHAPSRCAAMYTAFLQRVREETMAPAVTELPSTASSVLRQMVERLEPGSEEDRYARVHKQRWALTVDAIPMPPPQARALELGSYCVVMPLLRHYFKFDYVAGTDYRPPQSNGRIECEFERDGAADRYDLFLFNAESDRYPFDDGVFDLVLAWEIIEHLTMDPMFLMAETNRILKHGGRLLVTTPNVTSARSIGDMLDGFHPYLYCDYNRDRSRNRHNIEFAPGQVRAMLLAAGFEIERLFTVDAWEESPGKVLDLLGHHGFPTHLRGDNIVALARKAGGVVERYPAEVYR